MVKSSILIRISKKNKLILDKLKTYPRETYNDVLVRIIKEITILRSK